MHIPGKGIICLLLVAISFDCFAAAPVYFDLGGLILIVLGAILLVGGLIFYAIGGRKGVFVFFALVAISFIFLVTKSSLESAARHKAADKARSTIAVACLNEAGEFGQRLPYQPGKIYVRINENLHPGRSYSRTYLSISEKKENIELVNSFPNDGASDAVYVDISAFIKPIEGADDWKIRGIEAKISSKDGALIASRKDIERAYGWCLGHEPSIAIERFVKEKIGVSIGLTPSSLKELVDVPAFSPQGDVTPLQTGKFHEFVMPLRAMHFAKEKMQMLPAEADCMLEDGIDRDTAVCMPRTEKKNKIALSHLVGVHKLSGSWLSIMNTPLDSVHADTLTIVERSNAGALLTTWTVRFPGIEGVRGNHYEVRNIAVNGDVFTADLVFGREFARINPQSHDSDYRWWFTYLSKLSVKLQRDQNK